MGTERAFSSSAASVRLADVVAAFLDTITVANTRPYAIPLNRMVRDIGPDASAGPEQRVDRYCLAMATRSRSSGSMKWSLSSVPTSSWTHLILPAKRLSRAV